MLILTNRDFVDDISPAVLQYKGRGSKKSSDEVIQEEVHLKLRRAR